MQRSMRKQDTQLSVFPPEQSAPQQSGRSVKRLPAGDVPLTETWNPNNTTKRVTKRELNTMWRNKVPLATARRLLGQNMDDDD